MSNGALGLNASLPTEAQWEYACRAGTETPFVFGDNITPRQVNYNGEYPYASAKNGLYRKTTVVVKSLPISSWGLYEIHGNVYEWCQDWFGDYSVELFVDPVGSKNGARRVLRGGSWYHFGEYARSAYRYKSVPNRRNSSIGFRLALGQAGIEVKQQKREKGLVWLDKLKKIWRDK